MHGDGQRPRSVALDRTYGGPNLFERFNLISSLMYEGAEGTGRMLLAKPDRGAVDVALRLAEPVPFREPRWSRKVLQMASPQTARYNSGVRYVGATSVPRLAVVVSDDRTVDVIPVLRPRVRRSIVDEHVAKLETATSETYRSLINWLDKHRFYLDQTQCDRVMVALTRIEKEPMEVGQLRIKWPEFRPDPRYTAEYFAPEAG